MDEHRRHHTVGIFLVSHDNLFIMIRQLQNIADGDKYVFLCVCYSKLNSVLVVSLDREAPLFIAMKSLKVQ